MFLVSLILRETLKKYMHGFLFLMILSFFMKGVNDTVCHWHTAPWSGQHRKLVDKPARLIIRLLFGFASDSVFDKLNQSTMRRQCCLGWWGNESFKIAIFSICALPSIGVFISRFVERSVACFSELERPIRSWWVGFQLVRFSNWLENFWKELERI